MSLPPGQAIAFAGTAPFGAAILEGLLDAGEDVALVLTQPDRPAGRGRRLRASAVADLATERAVALCKPRKLHDPTVLDQFAQHNIGALVVAAFGQMVREPVLSRFLLLNVHGSLLPAYRGAAPVERAIMDGCDETGVCIMQMEAGLDTGPVAARSVVPIAIDDDAGAIYTKMAIAGVRDLVQVLAQAREGEVAFVSQPEAGSTYAHKLEAGDRQLDPAQPARVLHDRVRALSPHIGARLSIDGSPVVIWRTHPDPVAPAQLGVDVGALMSEAGALFMRCGDASALRIDELQPAGKRRMTSADWLRGLQTAPQAATPLAVHTSAGAAHHVR